MKYYKTIIKNLFLLKFEKKIDKRGFFAEIYNSNKNKKKINLNFLQQNISFSKNKSTFRGMHFQKGKFAQDKLIMLIKGEIDDYIFDLRKNSPTYKKQVKINLKEGTNQIIFVPKGCAHGFLTKKKNTIVMYSVTKNYHPNSDFGFNYKSLKINLPKRIIISDKDKNLPALSI
jgi:dTDP-4-dehydrorhamnose 3,5-epimerase